MAGVSVTFAVTGGGGTITGGTAVTNTAGVATVGSWTLGIVAGLNTLAASTSGLTPVTFGATGTAGAAATIVKIAGDGQTATVGTRVATSPSVRVIDANGNPVSGLAVSFTAPAGVEGGQQVTNEAGVASVGGWTLEYIVKVNTLTVTAGAAPAITFTATSTPGAPVNMVHGPGTDDQTALFGTAVAIPPSVTLTDQFGNVVAGATVTFAATNGGGLVEGANAVSNGAGVATVGKWTLGRTGYNTLDASIGTRLTRFTATGADPCDNRPAYTVGTTVNGELISADCQFVPQSRRPTPPEADGRYVDKYFTFVGGAPAGQTQAYLFTLSSASFDTYIFLYSLFPMGNVFANNDDAAPGTSNSALKVFLVSGRAIDIYASSRIVGATGSYTLSSSVTSMVVTNCENVFLLGGTTTQDISTSDCSSPGPYYSDKYFVRLFAGQSLGASMTSTAVDSFLEVYDSNGTLVAVNDNSGPGTLDASVSYTATSTGTFRVVARTKSASETGSYTITVSSPQQ